MPWMQEPLVVSPSLQYVLATRHLERIADHATNISEDIIFWVRGLDVGPPRPRALLKIHRVFVPYSLWNCKTDGA